MFPGVSDTLYAELQKFWSYYPKGYRFSPRFEMWMKARQAARRENKPLVDLPGWDGRKNMLKRKSLPAGLFRATWKDAAEALGLKFEIISKLPARLSFLPGIAPAEGEYSFQNNCATSMANAAVFGGGLVIAATGAGKTATTARFLSKLPISSLFVVDQKNLLYQTQEELSRWLDKPVGVVGDSKFQPEQHTAATIQTLQRHLNDPKFKQWFNQVEIVIVDEIHEQLNRRNFELLETIKPMARYGLTATLALTQKETRYRAYAFAGPVLFDFTYQEGVERGVLAKGRVLQLLFPPLGFSKNPNLEYRSNVIDNLYKRQAFVSIAKLLYSKERYTIALADRREHLGNLSAALDVPHSCLSGLVDQEDRVEDQEDFEAGEYRTILASRIFKKGVNIKRVDALVDLAERPSTNDARQKFGRGSRIHEDKGELLYIDFGTHTNTRLERSANARARALRAQGIPVRRVRVGGPTAALKAVEDTLLAMEREAV